MTLHAWWKYLPLVPVWIHESVKKENLELKKALSKADDNDHRDPVTGRFISEKRGSFTCGG